MRMMQRKTPQKVLVPVTMPTSTVKEHGPVGAEQLRRKAAETGFGYTVNYPIKLTLLALLPFSMA